MNEHYINNMAMVIYAQNCAVGWWDNKDRCVLECVQLICTEIAEATEGERKNLMDDHLPHRKMGEVELADAMIRALDLGGKLGLRYQRQINSLDLAQRSIGYMHYRITGYAVHLGEMIEFTPIHSFAHHRYSKLIDSIIIVAEHLGYDVKSAMEEKLAYNKQRADHKRENRALAHGKKF
jgi:hypothetical protein